MTQFKYLFSPIQVGSMMVQNRIVMSPMITNNADDEGFVTDRSLEYYRARAKGGVGWIIIESTYVHRAGIMYANQLGLDDDRYIDGLRKLATTIKNEGVRATIQLYHGGRRAQPDLSGYPVEAPSPIPLYGGAPLPHELTQEEIENRIEAYVKAALRAKEAGFDGIDIHAGHGYLICAFLAKFSNQRTDQFGGDIRGRARFLLEVVKRIRKQVGEGFVVTTRNNGSDFVMGGLTHKEAKQVAQMVEESGANAIQVTGGHGGLVARDFSEIVKAKERTGARSLKETGLKLHDQIEFDIHQPISFMRALPMGAPRGCFVHLAKGIKESVQIPVLVVGRINRPELAEEILKGGHADLVVIGRGLLADPELPKKAQEGDLLGIRPCIGCNYGCFENLFGRKAVRCTVNPYTGKESTLKQIPSPAPKKVMVVGAGPGGLEAAVTAAKRGHQVTLYEKEHRIGGQLNLASIPPDREEIQYLIPYYEEQIKRTGVNLRLGREITLREIKEENPDVLIMATGMIPKSLEVKGSNLPHVVQAIDVLSGKEKVHGKVLVVGGGSLGCEIVDFLSQKGSAVTLVEMLDKIAMDMHPDDRNFLAQKMIEYQVDVHLDSKVEGITHHGVMVTQNGVQKTIDADTVVMAIGSLPNRKVIVGLEIDGNQLSIHGKKIEVHFIGDCKEPRKILEAIHEGAEVALSL
jgi:2,4-dienoyl-CoA reductase-like NADH-dependent reductase (Old Yellow Enzyme family)/thioredoxin reductase